MKKSVLKALDELKLLLGEKKVLINELLKKHTSFKIGGSCIALVEPTSEEELIKILTLFLKHKVRFFVIGNGTNLLVKDTGVNAFIIKLSTKFSGITELNSEVTALAGTSLMKLNEYAMKHSLSGLEFSYGIPGSIGGAVYMNAGAYGGQMSDLVTSVRAFYKNKIVTLNKDDLKFSYRKSVFQKNKHYVILSVTLNLKLGEKAKIEEKAKTILEKRRQNHPSDPSAGSVFKRHKALIASKAIDEAGLKGFIVGGAQISEKHAGFIINKKNASFMDVIKLIKKVQKTIWKRHKKRLKLEVKILGD